MRTMNRFFKVNEVGFSVTDATFFNPVTGESFSKIVWDIDNHRWSKRMRNSIKCRWMTKFVICG
jgi:hypothetical protein